MAIEARFSSELNHFAKQLLLAKLGLLNCCTHISLLRHASRYSDR